MPSNPPPCFPIPPPPCPRGPSSRGFEASPPARSWTWLDTERMTSPCDRAAPPPSPSPAPRPSHTASSVCDGPSSSVIFRLLSWLWDAGATPGAVVRALGRANSASLISRYVDGRFEGVPLQADEKVSRGRGWRRPTAGVSSAAFLLSPHADATARATATATTAATRLALRSRLVVDRRRRSATTRTPCSRFPARPSTASRCCSRQSRGRACRSRRRSSTRAPRTRCP